MERFGSGGLGIGLNKRKLISFLAALSLTLTLVCGAPQGDSYFSPMFDDQTGSTYNYNQVAARVNRQLSTVPKLDLLPGNETPALIEKRKFNEGIDYEEEEEPPPPPPPMRLGPWMKYRQTYYNPFIYGGPNGPPTFVPQFGVWPTQNMGYQSQPNFGR